MDGSQKVAFDTRLQEFRAQAHDRSGSDLIATALDVYGSRLAVVSSFGAESAVLLHLVAEIDPSTPAIC